jgi:hypothetical protein
MTFTRLRFAFALGALALVHTYGCDSSPISPDDAGGDATAAAPVNGGAGHTGTTGGAGTIGSAGHTGGGATGSAGHTGGGGATGSAGAIGTAGHTGGAGATGSAGAIGTAGHGGGGAGGATGATCSDLAAQYSTALTAARSCTAGAAGQCAQMVSGSLSVCFSNCQTFVNNASTLNTLKAQWLADGCANQGPVACPAIACLQPTQGRCVAGDGGGATCMSAQLGIETN